MTEKDVVINDTFDTKKIIQQFSRITRNENALIRSASNIERLMHREQSKTFGGPGSTSAGFNKVDSLATSGKDLVKQMDKGVSISTMKHLENKNPQEHAPQRPKRESEYDPQNQTHKYQESVPDYMRIDEYFLKKENIKHPERISILCKNNGWLTVDSQTMDRNHAFEKNTQDQNLKQTSPSSPDWMQNQNQAKRDDDGYFSLKPVGVHNQ